MKDRAREERLKFGWSTPRVMKSDLRKAYKFYQIRIDLWPYSLKVLRGAYFNDENGVSVLINKNLPEAPQIFTMAHELKHHLEDSDLAIIQCNDRNLNEPIEIGAEVFAAELIYPDGDFKNDLLKMGVIYGECKAEAIIKLKHDTQTTLSYTALSKKAEFLQFAPQGAFAKIRWKKLEEEIYGEPAYKRIQRFRHGNFST
jgi:Zn-dependent peptidase ImmA (M78 family)